MPFAFRCTHCGHLVRAAAAGECKTPHSCPGCGCGVTFTTEPAKHLAAVEKKHGTGCRTTHHKPLPGLSKIVEHDHWEVLADATDARLAELGLARADVERHTPAPRGGGPVRPPVMAAASASEGPAVADREG